MKSLTNAVLVLTVLLIMGGCATSGPKFTELEPSISNLAPDAGRIYIYRRSSPVGAAIQPEVKLDGEVIGSSQPGGFFYVDRPSGTYEIMTTTEVERKLSLALDTGQIRYVRLNISMGILVGHVYADLIEPEVARDEIEDCRYTGQQKQ